MKIPETTPGAYYGNEENGQWQPNGVIIDGGVGGGVVGSGDAGIHRPPVYPLHIPRGPIPHPTGYVMGNAYYTPPPYPNVPSGSAPEDFAEYMWMEDQEEFDKQVMQQLEEEALMEQCIEAMLEDERRERLNNRPVANGHNHNFPTTSNGAPAMSLEETVSRSKLNPLAAEFVPGRARQPVKIEETKDVPEAPTTEEPPQKSAEKAPVSEPEPTVVENSTGHEAEEPSLPQDPPEVSAADVEPIAEKPQEKRPREVRKDFKPQPVKVETKKALKTEAKVKSKPVTVKSETKLPPKKKEVKIVKSEPKVEEGTEELVVAVADSPMPHPVPTEVPTTQAPPSFKPINYAAAAKANKPKKPSPSPVDKAKQSTPAKPIDKPKTTEKIDKREKTTVKQEKPVQRMNSTK